MRSRIQVIGSEREEKEEKEKEEDKNLEIAFRLLKGMPSQRVALASAAAVPLGSDGDPGCIFFTLNTYQATFIIDIL